MAFISITFFQGFFRRISRIIRIHIIIIIRTIIIIRIIIRIRIIITNYSINEKDISLTRQTQGINI